MKFDSIEGLADMELELMKEAELVVVTCELMVKVLSNGADEVLLVGLLSSGVVVAVGSVGCWPLAAGCSGFELYWLLCSVWYFAAAM